MLKHSIVRLGPNALVRGKEVKARGSGKPIHAFLGIPFAQPPLGELRFRRPQPIALWDGTKDALEYGPVCPQPIRTGSLSRYGVSLSMPRMSEDCLYLNVWTPRPSSEAKLPVMVWIHGGGFVYGFSNIFDGTAFADRQNIVYVSINYRLGIFGFMCLEDENAPGNMGLLDQIQALRWIQENIAQFGGDPYNVTLFGESAGGTSISFHTLSNLSKGLFHKVICQSGVSVNDFWLWPSRNAKKYISKRLQNMGCQATTSEDIIKWLATQDVRNLVESLGEGFFPVKDDFFISEKPLKLYKKGQFLSIPAIIGFNANEGTMFVFGEDNTRTSLSSYEEAELIAKTLVFNFFRGKKNVNKVYQAAWDFYIGKEKDMTEVSRLLSDMFGDIVFNIPSINAADMHSTKCPTFMYFYCHRTARLQRPDWIQADHGDEVEFTNGMPFLNQFPDIWPQEEKSLSETLMAYWANFARTGDPNGPGLPEWRQYSANEKNLQPLGGNVTPAVNRSRMHFWNETVPSIIEEPESKL